MAHVVHQFQTEAEHEQNRVAEENKNQAAMELEGITVTMRFMYIKKHNVSY